MIQPKSEYLDDQESVEDLTNLDDDMNDLNEMEQDNSRAGPSHDPSQHPGKRTKILYIFNFTYSDSILLKLILKRKKNQCREQRTVYICRLKKTFNST
jgi:hypothetical protein